MPTQMMQLDEIGLLAADKEDIDFVVLAYETWHKCNSNLPEATGAAYPVFLGNIKPGKLAFQR